MGTSNVRNVATSLCWRELCRYKIIASRRDFHRSSVKTKPALHTHEVASIPTDPLPLLDTAYPKSSKAALSQPPSPLMTTIIPGSINHSCLRSFLQYAHVTNLNQQSTHFLGTRYEYLVARALRRLGFSLVRVGRGGDAGVDLLGEWTLPTRTTPFAAATVDTTTTATSSGQVPSSSLVPPSPLRVLLQCKRHARRLVPEFVRELEGAFAGAPAGWRTDGSTIGFLVSPNAASRGVREALQRSRMPIGFIALEERISHDDGPGTARGRSRSGASKLVDDSSCAGMSGRVTQMLWNQRAQEVGLQGIGVTWKHAGEGATMEEIEANKELALTWNGWAVSSSSSDMADTSTEMGTVTELASMLSLTGSVNTITTTKKRGRPRKVDVKTEDNQASLPPVLNETAKKRGRPRKTKI